MSKITYTNKVALNENSDIADINKVKADDMNEIKACVNNNDDMLTGGAVAGNMVVNSIRTKNMFDKSTFVQGNEKNASPTIRVSSRQILYLEPGTYTFSCSIPSSMTTEVMVLNDKPGNATNTYVYDSGWVNSPHTFTTTSAGYFCINLRNNNGSDISVSTCLNYNYQLEEGSTAMAYTPYQNLNGVSQPKIIWSGEKYNYNDTINLYEPLETGHLYAFTCRGVSATYNVTLMYLFTGNTIQIAYANNGGDSYEGFRYRLTTRNNNQTLTIGESGQSQKLGSNTAILRIDKIM